MRYYFDLLRCFRAYVLNASTFIAWFYAINENCWWISRWSSLNGVFCSSCAIVSFFVRRSLKNLKTYTIIMLTKYPPEWPNTIGSQFEFFFNFISESCFSINRSKMFTIFCSHHRWLRKKKYNLFSWLKSTVDWFHGDFSSVLFFFTVIPFWMLLIWMWLN